MGYNSVGDITGLSSFA